MNLNDKIYLHFRHPIPSVLYRQGFITVKEMLTLDDKYLLSIRNFGKKAFEKVKQFREVNVNQHIS